MATASFPNSNLPTTSQPWGREVEKRIVDTAIKVDSNEVNNAARDRQLLAALNRTNIAVNNAQTAIDSVISVEEAIYYPGTTEIDGGNIRANTIAANKISAGELVGFTVKTGYSGNQRVELNSTNIAFIDSNNNSAGSIQATVFSPTVSSLSLATNTGQAGLLAFQGVGNLYGQNNSSVQVGTGGEGNVNIAANPTNGGITLNANYISMSGVVTSAGSISTDGGLTRTAFAGGGTTGASFNNNGTLIRTTSSARYKQDIENMLFDYDDILALEPKTFRLKDEVAEDDNARRYAGFIAEDLAGTPLDIFVAYRTNEDGVREADGIYYAELTSALLSAIKHQDGMIRSLESRIEALEGKV